MKMNMLGKTSLKTKMKILLSVLVVPLIILIIYLLFRLGTYSERYDSIYQNISRANEFSQTFKEKYDYSMYRIIIGSSTFEEEKPFEQLQSANEIVKLLRNGTKINVNKGNTKKINNFIEVLEEGTKKIEANLKMDGPKYDKNLEILDNDIRITTTLVTDRVQEYVYYETFQMEKVRESLKEETAHTTQFAIIAFVLLLIVTLILIETISNNISKPIKELCSMSRLVGKGDFTTRAAEYPSNEIITLTNSFNQMVERIGSLVEDVKEEQLNLRKTELKLLQSQINPHFLYNTLDTIVWLAEDKQNEMVVKMVSSLSNFFRTSLSKGIDFISFEEEVIHIQSYLQIQQFRYQDILDYEIHIAEDMKNNRILKMLLQPIVENALYHGIKKKRSKGKIIIEGLIQEDNLVLKVRDNGIGMVKEELDRLGKKLEGEIKEEESAFGYGLVNVNERIKLLYGKEYGLAIDSVYGEGCVVIITIPTKPKKAI